MTNLALAHDYLLVQRGAERSFLEMTKVWPDAPVYTLLYDAEEMAGQLPGRRVHTSYLQRLPIKQDNFRRLLPLFPHAAESLDVSEYDVLVSSSSAYAHGLRVREGAAHVCYCYTPFRYAWYEQARALNEVPALARPLLRHSLKRMRRWDRRAAERVTGYVAISELSRRRIAQYFGRQATVVHPPVDTGRFGPGEPEDFFLVASELVGHKRVDLALEAARRSGQRVKVVGGGPDEERLRVEYGDVAEFLGRVSDAELAALYPRCRAFVMPSTEEFGIAAVEAQAAGRPVLATDAGGARETVVPEQTGCLVEPDNVDAMASAMRDFDWDGPATDDLVANADRFSAETFRERMLDEVTRICAEAR